MLEKFKDWLLMNGNTYTTAKMYQCRINKILSVIKEENLSEETITKFMIELQKTNSVSTFNGYITALTVYLRFLKKDIPLPKVLKGMKTLPESMSELQMEKLIDTLSQILKRDFIKVKALFYFLFYSGIRIGEINTLKRADFDFTRKEVKILGEKTKEERIVTFEIKTKNALEEYFASEEEKTNAFNINSNAVQQRLKDMKKYVPDMNLHAHIFRHSFARYCLEVLGTDILTVSKLMGHANLITTERYLRLTDTQFRDIYHKKADNLEKKA